MTLLNKPPLQELMKCQKVALDDLTSPSANLDFQYMYNIRSAKKVLKFVIGTMKECIHVLLSHFILYRDKEYEELSEKRIYMQQLKYRAESNVKVEEKKEKEKKTINQSIMKKSRDNDSIKYSQRLTEFHAHLHEIVKLSIAKFGSYSKSKKLHGSFADVIQPVKTMFESADELLQQFNRISTNSKTPKTVSSPVENKASYDSYKGTTSIKFSGKYTAVTGSVTKSTTVKSTISTPSKQSQITQTNTGIKKEETKVQPSGGYQFGQQKSDSQQQSTYGQQSSSGYNQPSGQQKSNTYGQQSSSGYSQQSKGYDAKQPSYGQQSGG
eukprot:CAMPEP_0117432966 /NCGR_PEP_ID=MMETSP0758-20121206/12385_1 /TAXON_ID=63605 /ORGANISM="Percolomonas cosmopolitus, Strain AE-1 (ATCC 50343)" /LENGTH=324 /DNA_ID=CAMNT_0005223273 /DNA_START=227 /DNA_END=1198 /DNA_ORIENTATION=-